MITAAIVIFMAEGSLDDVLTGSQQQACVSQVQSQCQYGPSDQITAPTACQEMEESVTVTFPDETSEEVSPDQETINCR